MFPVQDQISVAAKANFEANFALYASLTSKTLESVEKLINLNLSAVKASMEESSTTTRQMLSAKDPQELLTLVSAQVKPNVEKALAYGSHVAGIASSAQSELSKATEAQMTEASRKIHELVEQSSRKAPTGTEGMIAFMKTVLDSANSSYEQLSRTGKQAAETLGANLNAAASQLAPAVTTKS
jgi:phasin family protein